MNLGGCKLFGDLLRLRAAHGGKPAFVWNGRPVSFAEVNARANRLVDALFRLGFRRGERLAVLSRNRPEVFECHGVAKGGVVAVPLNFRLTARELLHPFHDSRPAALVAEEEFVAAIDSLRPQLTGVRHFIVLGSARGGWLSYEALLCAGSDAEPAAEVDPGDALSLTYTSGTTGLPRAAILTHRSVLANCRAAGEALLDLDDSDVGLSVMPLFHVGGMWYHLFPSFASGGTTVIQSAFDAGSVLDAVREYGVTHVHVVPTMLGALIDELARRDGERVGLRTVYYAASPIPLALLKRAMEAFRGCRFLQSFGSTEAGCVTALSPEDHWRAANEPSCEHRLLSCGRAIAGARIEIRDAAGRALPAGEPGEVTVCSEGVMAGYWNNPAATREALVEGWLATGDIGVLDRDGYLTLVDRRHDMIVTGGENVYPKEVEDVLYENPDLAEAAVFAMRDPVWVERVAAAVVLRPGRSATPGEIRARAAGRLASYKCPKSVVFVDCLPKSATGKVLKRELRRLYGDWLASHPEG